MSLQLKIFSAPVLLCALVSFMAYPDPAAAGQVYKWVDEDGKTHYGDKPEGKDSSKLAIKKKTPPSEEGEAESDAGAGEPGSDADSGMESEPDDGTAAMPNAMDDAAAMPDPGRPPESPVDLPDVPLDSDGADAYPSGARDMGESPEADPDAE